jgi:hypothetical protein
MLQSRYSYSLTSLITRELAVGCSRGRASRFSVFRELAEEIKRIALLDAVLL